MKAREFPEEIKLGNASVAIYRNGNPGRPNGQDFKLAFYDVDGQRRFRSFARYREAKAETDATLLKATKGELETLRMSKGDLVAHTRAVQALQSFNVPLERAAEDYAAMLKLLGGAVTPLEAVRYYVRKHPRELPRKTVREVADELLAQKRADGLSAVYLSDLRYRYGKFADAFHVPIGSVTAGDLREFHASLRLSPRSHNHFVRTLVTLFEFAKSRGYQPKDHDEAVRLQLKKDRGGEIDIFTPEEMAKLLARAAPDVIPVFAIGAFAGLRSAEIERLDGREVHLAERFIEVTAGKSKTTSRRLAPVPDNLAAWLTPHARSEGAVWPHSHPYFYEAQRDTARCAGLRWKHNALRHSFISYRLAQIQNANQVALEAGNSPNMIFAHYRELVRPADAVRWSAIVPEQAANVVPLAAAG
ncbi:MAG: site-specific integrase [Verrucomicrobia bacterium]|nr:site-specific integrase [Verrucomicrobiota bacterium]